MSVKVHLILQELVIGPSKEWNPCCQGWILVRVAEGAGYWLRQGTARELNPGDSLILGFDDKSQLRASVLCSMKLHFFTVYPQYLGLLTVEEWYQFNTVFESAPPYVRLFQSDDPAGEEFARLVKLSSANGFSSRCALLQFWANLVVKIPAPVPVGDDHSSEVSRLRERFRQLFRQMSVTELSVSSPPDLAEQLNCSVRHFRRLFIEEFGMPFRAHQMKLRLLRARQLLVESNATVTHVANECGYRHMSFFNSMFKKRFGMTPGAWRSQTRKELCPPGRPRE